MKALINDIETWSLYQKTNTAIWNGHRDFDQTPKDVRDLIERPEFLTTADMSHDLLKSLFIESCKKYARAFNVDKNNESVINLFIQYLRKDPAFLKANPSYRFGKGLLLRGAVGTGKTVLFKGFNDLKVSLVFYKYIKQTHDHTERESFTLITSNQIVENFSLDGYEIFTNHVTNRRSPDIDLIHKPLFIDDIGSESIATHYGASVNIIAELLIRRYEKVSLTHVTTNLDPPTLKKIYDVRVFDRMREMFNDIVLPGESRRK